MNECQSTLFIHTQAPFSVIKPLWLQSPCYFSSRARPTTSADWHYRQVHYTTVCFSMLRRVRLVVPYSVAYTSGYVVFPVDIRALFISICNSMTARYYIIRVSTTVCTYILNVHKMKQNELLMIFKRTTRTAGMFFFSCFPEWFWSGL